MPSWSTARKWSPKALDDLTPEERRDVYKMMRLKLIASRDGSVEVTGVFGGPLEVGASRSIKTEDSWLAHHSGYQQSPPKNESRRLAVVC